MAGIRFQPEESDISQLVRPVDIVSDDDRSIAADSWSIKSDYGSTLDDDQRHADAAEALFSPNLLHSSDYSSDKEEEPDAEGETSTLGLQSYWDAVYADELAKFREHGHAGEVWFGENVMEVVASWTKSLCMDISQGHMLNHINNDKYEPAEQGEKLLSSWSVLDVGTGNGLLLHELAKQGFSDLTGIDYSEGAIDFARNLADRDGYPSINFLVDDVLETKLDRCFQLVMDKGTLDSIRLHPSGPVKRIMYWDSVSKLVAPGGIVVITSCNSTKDEMMQEVDEYNQRRIAISKQSQAPKEEEASQDPLPFQYINHVSSYPTFSFGGSVGSQVSTVAFLLH